MTFFFICFCIVIFCCDILLRRVPNSALLFMLLVHAGYFLATGYGINDIDIRQSLIGGVVALIIFIPLYALRAMGAGDVKFLAVLGVLLGLKYLAIVWLLGSLLAGLHAIAFYRSQIWISVMPQVVYRMVLQMTESNMYQRMLNNRQGRKGIPYAAYLAIGAVLLLLIE